jgi:UDP-N-acetylglucosamine acyltransferase
LAIIEKGAELAGDVCVGPFSYVGAKVRIAPGCVIANNVTLIGKTTLGEKCAVFPMAVVGAAPDASGRLGECVLGKANAIREHVTIYAGLTQPTRIGNDNLIMIGCQVGAGAVVGDHGIFANCTQIGPEARVGDYVRASGFTVIEAGATVGAYTFTAGYAGVDHDAPPFAIVQGFPFRVRGVNTENLRRCGFGEDDIHALKTAFREMYDGSGSSADPAAIRRWLGLKDLNPHVRRLIEEVRASAAKAGAHSDG